MSLFLIDDEPEYEVFKFDHLCYASKCLIASATKFDSPPVSLELKSLSKFLKYSVVRLNDTSPIIIAFDLDQDQEESLVDLLTENKEAISWTLMDLKGIIPRDSTCRELSLVIRAPILLIGLLMLYQRGRL